MSYPGHNRAPGALLDVETLCHNLEQLGLDWADKRAAADALDEASKSVLGAALLRSEGRTVGEKDAKARNDPEFARHLAAVASAKKASYRASILYEVQKVRTELTRSNASTERTLAALR